MTQSLLPRLRVLSGIRIGDGQSKRIEGRSDESDDFVVRRVGNVGLVDLENDVAGTETSFLRWTTFSYGSDNRGALAREKKPVTKCTSEDKGKCKLVMQDGECCVLDRHRLVIACACNYERLCLRISAF